MPQLILTVFELSESNFQRQILTIVSRRSSTHKSQQNVPGIRAVCFTEGLEASAFRNLIYIYEDPRRHIYEKSSSVAP